MFGDRYDMVHGLWQQTAKGALMIKGSDDIGIQSDSELRMIANSVNTTATFTNTNIKNCLLYTSPSPRDYAASRMPSSA